MFQLAVVKDCQIPDMSGVSCPVRGSSDSAKSPSAGRSCASAELPSQVIAAAMTAFVNLMFLKVFTPRLIHPVFECIEKVHGCTHYPTL